MKHPSDEENPYLQMIGIFLVLAIVVLVGLAFYNVNFG